MEWLDKGCFKRMHLIIRNAYTASNGEYELFNERCDRGEPLYGIDVYKEYIRFKDHGLFWLARSTREASSYTIAYKSRLTSKPSDRDMSDAIDDLQRDNMKYLDCIDKPGRSLRGKFGPVLQYMHFLLAEKVCSNPLGRSRS